MGPFFSIVYSILLAGAGVYAILLGHDLLPKTKERLENKNEEKPINNKIQFTIAGIILIYFGLSTLYGIWR